MSTMIEVEEAVKHLSPTDLNRFREWFSQFEAEDWDQQFERDARTGRLDRLAEKAIVDYNAGHYTEL
jgi:hypothetical protein